MNSSIQVLTNLALSPHMDSTSLIEIGLVLRDSLPRWEEIWSDYDSYILAGDPNLLLPVYCFRCGKTRGEIQGGYLRDSCHFCSKENNSSTKRLQTFLWALHSTTGYPIEVWEYLILQSIQQHPRRCFQ